MEITSHRYKPDTVVCILDEADIASDPSLAAHFEKTHASLLRGPNGLEIIYIDGRLPELQHGRGYRPEVLDVMIAHELGHLYYGPQHGAQPNRPYEEREADDVAWVVLSTCLMKGAGASFSPFHMTLRPPHCMQFLSNVKSG